MRCDLRGSKSRTISPSHEQPLHRSTSIELSPIPSPPTLVEPMQFASTLIQADDSTTILRDRKQKLTQEKVKATDSFQIPDANNLSQSNRVCIVQDGDHVNLSTNYASTRKSCQLHDEYHPETYPEGCIGSSTLLDIKSVVSPKSILPNSVNPYQTNSCMKSLSSLDTTNFSSRLLLVRHKIQEHFSIPSNKIVDRSLYLIDETKSDNVKNGENFLKNKNSASSYDRYRSKKFRRKVPRQTNAIFESNIMLFCGWVMSRKELVFYVISFGIVINVAVLQTYFSVHQVAILDISKTTKLSRLAHQRGSGRVQKADYNRKIFVRVTWPNQSATDVMRRTEKFISVDGVRKINLTQKHVKYDVDHTQKIIDNRRNERRRRTSKPLMQDNLLTNEFMINKYEMMSNQWMKKVIQPEDLESDRESLPNRWEVACLGAGLTTSSRVVITEILTIPAASAFALLISKHCNVELIQGVDKIMPNTQQNRINAMTVYQNLLHRIPNIKLVIPNDSVGFDVDASNKDSNSIFPPFLKESENWIQEFKPTHIIHFESMLKTTFETDNVNNFAEDNDQLPRSIGRLFLLKNSISSAEQLLRYVLNIADGCQNASCEKRIEQSTRFLYINSGQQFSVKHNEKLLWNGIFRRNYLLFQSYFAMSTAVTSHKFENISLHHLRFPNQERIPANEETERIHKNSKSLSVKEAVMSILRSLNKESANLVEFLVPDNADHNSAVNVGVDDVLLNDFHRHLASPYELSRETMNDYGRNELHALLGLREEVLPCASSCTSGVEQSASYSQQCSASPFDDIIPISVEATKGCGYVVFVVEVSKALKELIQPIQSTTSQAEALPLCRIAFVSEHSSLVQGLVKSKQTSIREDEHQLLRTMNGKLKHDSWTLIWLPYQEESRMSDVDFSLLIIDPSKLFAPTVSKSMYTSVLEFAEPSDESLLRIMGGINRPKIPKHMEKEYRSGHKIFRFVLKEAENARSAIFFGMEPSIKIETLPDYQMLINSSDSTITYSSKQMKFYEESSHIIESERFRLETEIQRDNYFDKFPFQWISMAAIIHDLRLDEALSLRCNWYKEHLFWGTNGEISNRKGTEPLSLAYLLGKMKLEGTVGLPIDLQQNWYPLLDANTNSIVKNERDAGIFLRIMKRAVT